jgi:hypothetical protein
LLADVGVITAATARSLNATLNQGSVSSPPFSGMLRRLFLKSKRACGLDVMDIHGEAVACLVPGLAGPDLQDELLQEATPVGLNGLAGPRP